MSAGGVPTSRRPASGEPAGASKATSLFDVVRWHAQRSGGVVAAIDGLALPEQDEPALLPAQLTYAALHEAGERLAAVLAPCVQAADAILATWMRRGNAWYCVFCAAARLQVPLVALSSDLPDKAAEAQRNAEILTLQRPAALVADDSADLKGLASQGGNVGDFLAEASVMLFPDLWHSAWAKSAAAPGIATSSSATLCYCYTGGTTKASRSARVTHEMALHEVAAYPQICNLGNSDRILQQHSMYWAASAYGELDIALAFGCAVVFAEAWGTDGAANAISTHQATCAGLVPSVLAALEPADVPSLRLVFTWGEALRPRVAREWAQQVHLIDLLISTECWLSLYADWSQACSAPGKGAKNPPCHARPQRPPFRVLPNVGVRLGPIGTEDGTVMHAQGHAGMTCTGTARPRIGELLVSGPMVSLGYTDSVLNGEAFETDSSGICWYHTRDCVEQLADGGLAFTGRADDLVKVGGAWVDIRNLEARLAAVEGVTEACISGRDAFLAFRVVSEDTLARLRSMLPPDFALFVVPTVPRRAGTGKVDHQALRELISSHLTTVPVHVDREAQLCEAELDILMSWHKALGTTLGTAALLHASWRQSLPLLDAYSAGLTHVGASDLAALALPLGLRVLAELAVRLPCFTYLVLGAWHQQKFFRRCRHLPLGFHGLAWAVSAALPSPWLGVVAAPGVYYAARRGRLLSWPLVCAAGLPLWLRDAGAWMTGRSVRNVADWYASTCGSGARQRGAEALSGVGLRLRRLVGRARRCNWCKKHHALYDGHVELSVDNNWYCSRCWMAYKSHRQCSRCHLWTAKGRAHKSSGIWVCVICQSPAREANGSGGAAATNGSEGGRGRKRPAVERCIVRLPKSSTSATSSRSAAAEEEVERPRVRQRTTSWSSEVADISPGAVAPTKEQKTREWRIVERAAGMSFGSPTESLAGLDSLRHTKITSALRREAGKRLPRDSLKRAATLGALLEEIARLQEEPPKACASRADAATARREFATWGMMWHSKCQWILRRRRPLRETALRLALRQLVERHAALRTQLRDPYPLFGATQQAFTAFELWRAGAAPPALAPSAGLRKRIVTRLRHAAVRTLSRWTRWSFEHAWPRASALPVEAGPDAPLPLSVLSHSASSTEAEDALWAGRGNFEPPFRAVLAPFGKGGEEGALLYLAVTHMFSDGYSVVPLLSDLAHLVSEAETSLGLATLDSQASDAVCRQPTPSLESRALPMLPCMLEALEPRLFHTVEGGDGGSGATARRGGITREPIVRKWGPDAIMVYATLPAEVVGAIRRAAHFLTVPEDIAMLTLLGTTLAWFEHQPTEPIAMIVPQRDGPSENDMVGLFADIRHLCVCTAGLSFAGVALRLHHVVKERLWCAPGVATQNELALINFEWTDFDELHGFSQHVSLFEQRENARHPVKIAVEQPDKDTWQMRVAFNPAVYGESERDRFLELFERSLHGFLQEPLGPVWPEDHPDKSARWAELASSLEQ